ncbi:MAG: hypothetical protein KDD03_11900 [Gelidibacter sp.]|nr:hypothetical protein [Gelidibacter sp.]
MAKLIQASDQSSKLRIVPHFGDVAMMLQLMRSKIWRELYEGSKKPYWRILVWLFAAKIEMFASASRCILRYRHGHNTTGLLMGLWVFSMIAAFNMDLVIGWLLVLIPFFSPLLVFVLDWGHLEQYLFLSIKSNLLLGFMVVSTSFQMVHVLLLKTKKGCNKDACKRGNSWLLFLLPNRFESLEIWVQTLIEPLLIVMVGLCGWWFFGDTVFLSFMVLSAISLCIQELADEMYRMYHGRI